MQPWDFYICRRFVAKKAREAQPTFLLFKPKIEYQQMDFSSSSSPRKATEISDDELVFGAVKACLVTGTSADRGRNPYQFHIK